MTTLLLVLFLVPLLSSLAKDPAPGLTWSRNEVRNMECQRLSEEEARRRFPGRVAEASPREDFIEVNAVACAPLLMTTGERPAGDEAILLQLGTSTADIVEAAVAGAPEYTGKTWLVEANYPNPVISGKIATAAKSSLMQKSIRVVDRVPVLAAGDVQVVGRLAANKAYPLACQRYFAEGSLLPNEVLLAVALRDRRETILHAGICSEGAWRWVR